MKKRYWLFLTVVIGLVISNSCKKEDNALSIAIWDIDGNKYYTLTIGTQVWMTRNLRTTRFNDGTAIPLVEDSGSWSVLTEPGYCAYNNNPVENGPGKMVTYGALYNWYTINTCKLCPSGWHVPTDAEWTVLTDFLGGTSVAGGKLKWGFHSNASRNNSFTALPGGFRDSNGGFRDVADAGGWWSSTEGVTNYSWYRYLIYNDNKVTRGVYNNKAGFSVRCIKD